MPTKTIEIPTPQKFASKEYIQLEKIAKDLVKNNREFAAAVTHEWVNENGYFLKSKQEKQIKKAARTS